MAKVVNNDNISIQSSPIQCNINNNNNNFTVYFMYCINYLPGYAAWTQENNYIEMRIEMVVTYEYTTQTFLFTE